MPRSVLSSFRRRPRRRRRLWAAQVFVSEQKLYTRAQLDRHAAGGNSVADGPAEERGGFAGHPLCSFCGRRFYGDNELYHHMNQEHFNCFLCQRAQPANSVYYKNYADLEVHFRHDHFLCESPDCLEKKFVAFPSESELKRHNATQHGGNMTRAQRQAALQIPVNFTFRRSSAQEGSVSASDGSHRWVSDRSHGRGRAGGAGGDRLVQMAPAPDLLQAAMHNSLDSANLESALRESAAMASATTVAATAAGAPGEPSPSTETTSGGAYARSLAQGPPPVIAETAFPPLPSASKSAKKRAAKQRAAASANSGSLAQRLGCGGVPPMMVLNRAGGASSSSSSSPVASGREDPFVRGLPRSPPPAQAVSAGPAAVVGPSDRQDATAEQLADGSGGDDREVRREALRAANRELVERIRAGLRGNEAQFADFRDVSARFRRGEMAARPYYGHIARLGIAHVVPELAALCPVPARGAELMEAHREAMLARPGGSIAEQSGGVAGPPGRSRGNGSTPSEVADPVGMDGYRRNRGKQHWGAAGTSSDGSASTSASPPRLQRPAVLDVSASSDAAMAIRPSASASNLAPLQGPPAPSASDSSWVCSVCTLVNDANRGQCSACEAAAPEQGAVAGRTKAGTSDSSSAAMAGKKKKGKGQQLRFGDGSVSTFLAASSAAAPPPWGGPAASQGPNAWANGGGGRLASVETALADAWGRPI
eukprot:SM000050S16981  [mRNA]  locus=s50:216870:219941:+ [translate_table: standard]